MTITLSTIRPDFEDLVAQFEAALSTRPAWKDRLTSPTAQTIIEMMAAFGAYSQFSIESALQESYPESAKNNLSLFAASNFAGVRVNRKQPASITVSMSAPSAVTIPVNSQFNGAGTYWFNREALSLSPTPQDVTLYQGEVVTKSIYGLGTAFQAFVSPEKEFVVSDTDVYVKINSTSIQVIQEGLWTLNGEAGAQQFTLPSGQMILLFGNGTFGSQPSTNDLVAITYVITLGEDGSNVTTLGKSFSLSTDANVTGTATSAPSGGASQADPLVYKSVTPALFGAFNASVTSNQYKKLPLQYPGVIDGFTLSQREINPKALTWMNVIKVCLLTQTPWGSVEWDNFKTWFNRNSMFVPEIVREDPVAAPVNIVATVRCKNYANLGTVKTNCEAALTALFAPRQGIIGQDTYRDDITNAIRSADSNVDYVILESPSSDIVLQSLAVGRPVLTTATVGGTLAADTTYDYAVSIVSSLGGETAPANWASITTGAGATNKNTISWAGGQANVASYKIWGRQSSGTLGLLATVSSSTLSWEDTGSVTPTGTVPVQSTINSYYPQLVSVTLTVEYTNRDALNY